MAVIGTSSGGYATVDPIQGNPIGNAMQNVENSAFKYREEQTQRDQIAAKKAKAEQEARDAQAKDMLDYSSKHKIVPTTIDSVNKASMDFALANKNAYAKARGVLNSSSNPEERTKAMEAIANLDSAYDAYKAMPEMLNTSAKDLEEGVLAGKYNPDSSIEAAKTIKAMSDGSMKVVFGDDGIPKIITYQRDAKGNLTNIIDKELTTEQLKLKLSPIVAYSDVKLADEFKKSLGDKVKTDVGTKTIEGYPGLVDAAVKKADSVASDRNQMYAISKLAGVQPKFDLSEYTPEEVQKVKNYVKQSLTEKYKDSVTDNDAKLSRLQQAENQRRLQANADREYNYKVNKDLKEDEKDGGNTTFTAHVYKKGGKLGNSEYIVPNGSKKLVISSKGYKDVSGATRILQEAVRTPDGKVIFGINERKVNMAKLTPEAEKMKNQPGFDKTDPNNYQVSEKVNYYDLDKNSDKISLAVLNTQNPDTGKNFISLGEAKKWVEKNTPITETKKTKQAAKPAAKNTKPKTVIQNGYTYTLNEATGQYE